MDQEVVTLNVAAIQYAFSQMADFQQFTKKIKLAVRNCVKKNAQLICFPEYLGYHLELFEQKGELEQFLDLFQNLAYQHKIFIQAGSILVQDQGKLMNRAYLFLPNGLFDYQDKIKLTPAEKEFGLQSGNGMKLFPSPWGPIGIAICYDSEFPNLTKDLVRQGANLIIVPSCTETLAGYYRVALCSRARAIENQCYVIQSCTVDSAGGWLDASYGRAGIYSPCDGDFPPDGILAQGPFNKPFTIFANLVLDKLKFVRQNGSVRNYLDYTQS